MPFVPSPKFAGVKFFGALAFLLSAISANAGSNYSDAEAANHEGEKAEVHGKVFDVHVTQSGMVMINFGAKYPAQTFTAVIFKDHADQFPEPEKFLGTTLSVSGEIKMHNKRPEMVVDAPAQLKVLAEAPAATPPPAPVPGAAGKSAETIVGPDGVTRRIVPFSF